MLPERSNDELWFWRNTSSVDAVDVNLERCSRYEQSGLGEDGR